ANVIYLPTYRRIEKDYFSIYGDIDKRVANYIINLFPEIDDKIYNEKLLDKNNFSETEEDLNKLFSNIINSRNTEKWIKSKSNNEKLEMIEFGMTDVSFKIKEFYDEKKDGKVQVINQFVDLINKYLNSQKLILFDEELCELYVENKSVKEKLNLNDLSSGEKQLIS